MRQPIFARPLTQEERKLIEAEVSELRTRHKKLTQSGETTAKMSKEWGK